MRQFAETVELSPVVGSDLPTRAVRCFFHCLQFDERSRGFAWALEREVRATDVYW